MDDLYVSLKSKKIKEYQCFQYSDLLTPLSNKNKPSLSNQLISLYNYLKPTIKENKIRNHIISKIEKIIKQNNLKMKIFGSNGTEMYLPSSDIDIMVSTNENNNDELDNLALQLANNKIINSNYLNITNTKIPIIRCFDCSLGLRIDISNGNNKGYKHLLYIREILNKHSYIKIYALILKKFIKQRNLHNVRKGGLCSYAQFLMLYHFLMMHPLIQTNKIDPVKNIGVIFMDFFQFYGKIFNYRTSLDIANLCYVRNEQKESLSIIDPLDVNNDVGIKCTSYYIIKDVFYNAFNIMKNCLFYCKGSYQLTDLWIKISDSDINFRKELNQRYDDVMKAGS